MDGTELITILFVAATVAFIARLISEWNADSHDR
jgi:hypothetical protein